MKKIILVLTLLVIFSNSFSQTGNVGIGTDNPLTRLHVADSGVVFTGSYETVIAPFPGLPPVSGTGARLMWYPRKAAFRVGAVNGSQWDFNNIGLFSMALGHNAMAIGESSVALGNGAYAEGPFSSAIGTNTNAIGAYSSSFNYGGYASGQYASAFGQYSFAKAMGSFTIGRYNNISDNPNPASSLLTDRIFQIGNGTDLAFRSNAITILRNGNIGIGGSISPGFPLNFDENIGDKISLWGQSGNHYGFGVLSGRLTAHTDLKTSAISFGYGSTASYNESFRFIGNGQMYIDPVDSNNGTLNEGAILFGAPYNTSEGIASRRKPGINRWGIDFFTNGASRMTVKNGGGVEVYQYLGIDTLLYGFPLSFDTTKGDKINLSGNYGWHYGIGYQTDKLQIHTNGIASDIVFGFGQSSGMFETMRIKGNGQLNIDPTNQGSGFLSERAISFGSSNSEGILSKRTDGFNQNGLDFITASSSKMTIMNNGVIYVPNRIGIRTTTPAAQLHVVDSSVVFTSQYNLPLDPPPPPVSGLGTRMMWYSMKGAFRAGSVASDQWDAYNIGKQSVAFGFATIASGEQASAFGSVTTASGHQSFSSGHNNVSSGQGSMSSGGNNTASGHYSSSFGNGTVAKTYAGFTVGRYNENSDLPTGNYLTERIFQIGNGPNPVTRTNALTVLGNGNIGIGGSINPGFKLNFDNTEGDKISLFGQSGAHYGFGIAPYTLLMHTDLVNSDIAFGYGSSAAFTPSMRLRGSGQLFIDPVNQNNRNLGSGAILFGDPGATGEGIASKRTAGVYQWGIDFFTNGTSRMTVKNGGGVDVHGAICASAFNACSDIRFKTNFSSIHNALQSVLSLNGIYYDWKTTEFPDKHFSNARQLGFSAQEIEKLFPEIVQTDAEGYKSVDYSRMTPVLVEAIKEQQKEINAVKAENAAQKKENELLKNQLEKQQKDIDELKETFRQILK